jgi:Na+/proline symporter/signal transduction histidine kinase
MSPILLLVCSIGYVALLFGIAWVVEYSSKVGKKFGQHSWIYALTLTVYCTAWTFYGSIGKASNSGLAFLGVYLGPTLFSPLWLLVLHKMILISKNERIGSIADFISARYGKSNTIGIVTTIVIVIGIIPYISIQIQAVTTAVNVILIGKTISENHITLLITLAMAVFAIVFGTRKLDPNEQHKGLMASIAFEGVVKLIAFLIAGIVITFSFFGGIGDLFSSALKNINASNLLTLTGSGIDPYSWFTVILLSLFAFILLPRQFHVAVVENGNVNHIKEAVWLVPLYLLLINFFVLPIALAGKMLLPESVNPESYILSIPLSQGMNFVALIVFIGGFSAAISMVVVESTALSIMMSNQIFIPSLLKLGKLGEGRSGQKQLLNIRRTSIVLVLVLAYIFEQFVTASFDIVSIGLISFAAIAQLAPATFGGMYWKNGNYKGALSGIIIGFIIWSFCLPLPYLCKARIISSEIMDYGLFGINWLKPYALFGLDQLNPITHGTFWSLLLNTMTYTIVSEWTNTDTIGLQQSDRFINVSKYTRGEKYHDFYREADLNDLKIELYRFLGVKKTNDLLTDFQIKHGIKNLEAKASGDLINFAELQLTGVLGAASARIVINGIAEAQDLSYNQVMQVLEQTKEALEHSRLMETKNSELFVLTSQLKEANLKLKELDKLKATFIASVTHELRTPITSILAFSQILKEDRLSLSNEKTSEYLEIIIKECKRITRLVNQVLDLEIAQSDQRPSMTWNSMREIVEDAIKATHPLFNTKKIDIDLSGIENFEEGTMMNKDQIQQVVINLLTNASKFCPNEDGFVALSLSKNNEYIILEIEDNGPGINPGDESKIFEQFYQSNASGKPEGAGLGLFISTKIMEKHHGSISVKRRKNKGAIFYVTLPLINPTN